MKFNSNYPKIVLACVFLLILSSFSYEAIASEWAKTYGGSYEDQARSIQQTTDGGYIVAGWTESFGAVGRDILIIKLDKNGTLQWQRRYGGSEQDRAYSIQQTNDGGYIVAGESSSFSADRTTEMWILKLRSNGDIDWQKCYSQPIEFAHEGAYSARQTSDGGYIIAGWGNSPGDYSDILVMKLTSDGSISWQKIIGKQPDGSYSFDPHNDVAYSIEQTSDGGYIIGATTTVPGNTWYPVPWIIKLDPNGVVQWNEELPFQLYTNYKKLVIRQTNDNGFIYVANLYNSVTHEDALVIKLNADGSPEWIKKYTGSNIDIANDIQQTNDGGYVLTGGSNSFSGTIASELWLLKLSSTGDIQWQKQYGDAHHSCVGLAVQQARDGDYIVAGMSTSADFWVLKLDSNGSIPDCPIGSSTNAESQAMPATGHSNSLTAWAHTVEPSDSSATVASPNINLVEQCSYYPVNYGLTVSVNPAEGGTITGTGINCPDECSEPLEEGTSITLTALPSDGYQFTGWNGDCEGCDGSTCITTMDSDKDCTALFEPLPDEPPVIDSFNAYPVSGEAPLAVTFTCEATDPDGMINAYGWDFDGDGIIDETSGSGTAQQTYDEPGTYHSTCTAVDNDGATTTSDAVAITVQSTIQPVWQDVTGRLDVTHSTRPLFDRRHRCFFVQVTVQNPDEESLSGPIRMVITQPSIPLKEGVGVGLEPDGYTKDGNPYFVIVPEDGSLDAGQELRNLRVNFQLQRKRLTYGIRIEQLQEQPSGEMPE